MRACQDTTREVKWVIEEWGPADEAQISLPPVAIGLAHFAWSTMTLSTLRYVPRVRMLTVIIN